LTTQAFFLRERFIKSAFELVDLFIVPSEDARDRFVAWGLPAEKVRTETYGRFPVAAIPDPPNAGRRRRIGFFGQLTRHKGIDVLLEAMKILDRSGTDVHLLVKGASLGFQIQEFRDKIRQLLEETAGSVDFAGSYTQEELPKLLSAVDWVIVPSVWWETGPLIIHEALMHRRPVICSNIGSMKERVQDGINGLHFRARDPWSLADTIRRAVDSPELWDKVRSRITDPRTMDEHLTVITDIYRKLLGRPAPDSRVA
jgi:glycosyltransferase involved in cell wall biosynthesis